MKKALQTQMDGKGFSMVEIVSTCPTNWGMTPSEAWIGCRAICSPTSRWAYSRRREDAGTKSFCGFGGQGVLLMGQILAYAGMLAGRNVSWLPSYGPEMRGGTANCHVILSDEPVGSPVVSRATTVIALNRPSLDKFESVVQPGGKLFINSSIIDSKAQRADVEAFYVPCNGLAEALGNGRVANMVMLGAYISRTGCVDAEYILKALRAKLGERKADLLEINRKALEAGAKAVQ